LIIFLYIIVVAIINISGHSHEVVDSWNKALGIHIDGFTMFLIYLSFVFILQGLEDINSKLRHLEKKLKED
jgi:hypothetical protein